MATLCWMRCTCHSCVLPVAAVIVRPYKALYICVASGLLTLRILLHGEENENRQKGDLEAQRYSFCDLAAVPANSEMIFMNTFCPVGGLPPKLSKHMVIKKNGELDFYLNKFLQRFIDI